MRRGDGVGIGLASIAAILFVACGSDDRPSESSSRRGHAAAADEDEPGYRVVEVTEVGAVGGNVRWGGELPELADIEVRTHRAECGETQPPRTLRVSSGGGVVDAVISLVDIRRGEALVPPEEPLTIDNVECRFEPHVLLAGAGWPLRFANSDSILHNVHVFSGRRSVLDLGLPERGVEVRRAIGEPGVYRAVDDAAHPWQEAWIHVFEHPYHATTDADGHFRISRVPPGRYTLRVWHEGWRVVGHDSGRPRHSNPVVLSRAVSVSVEHETVVDFELSQESSEIAGD